MRLPRFSLPVWLAIVGGCLSVVLIGLVAGSLIFRGYPDVWHLTGHRYWSEHVSAGKVERMIDSLQQAHRTDVLWIDRHGNSVFLVRHGEFDTGPKHGVNDPLRTTPPSGVQAPCFWIYVDGDHALSRKEAIELLHIKLDAVEFNSPPSR